MYANRNYDLDVDGDFNGDHRPGPNPSFLFGWFCSCGACSRKLLSRYRTKQYSKLHRNRSDHIVIFLRVQRDGQAEVIGCS